MENETSWYLAQIEVMNSEVLLEIPFGRAGHRLASTKLKEPE
jgi:hypothetical protein